jgi:hypothetical protein
MQLLNKIKNGTYYLLVEDIKEGKALCSYDENQERCNIEVPLSELEEVTKDFNIGNSFEMKVEHHKRDYKLIPGRLLNKREIEQIQRHFLNKYGGLVKN